jgi:flagellar hook-basal body complex protein FliE
MEQALGRQIHTDLASIRSAAEGQAGPIDILPAAAEHGGGLPGTSFSQSLTSALHSVDDKERGAADRMAAVDSGRSDDLVGAMLASQDASLSFSMLMQVRNKVMGAVEDLMKLPL